MQTFKNIGILLVLTTLLTACGADFEGLSVDEYIAQNNLTTTELTEGVHIMVTEPTNNAKPPNLDTRVVVNYKGYLTDGTVFDENDNYDSKLRNVIRGWQIGVSEMTKGSSATLIIPPTAGYGAVDQGAIPGNSVLIFEVDLLDF